MRKRLFAILILLGLAPSSDLQAQEDSISNILFVGNSYVMRFDLPDLTTQICGDLGMEISPTLSAAGGATLNEHWNQSRQLKTISLIESGDYDWVILQDQSKRPLRDKSGMHRDVAAFADFAAKHGAQLALFSTWARKSDSPSQQEKISEAYREAAQANQALVLPVGDAWQRAKEDYPDSELYTSDGSHPSKLGATLSALIVCSELRSGLEAEELASVIDKVQGLRPRDKDFLKEFATTIDVSAQGDTTNQLFERMSEHVEKQENRLVEIRHDLHRNPEISGAEVRTSRVVVEELGALGFEIRSGVGGHGIVATLGGGKAGPIVAFRADMDAVQSVTEDPVEYRSLIPGVRHICGHDVHTTIGIGLAEGFAAVRDELPGTVMLIFQPAEERGTGAKAMLADGAFSEIKPDAIYSLHTTPYNVGQVATRQGGLMAGRASISVKISGGGDLEKAYSIIQETLKSVDSNSPQDADVPSPEYFIRVELYGGQVGKELRAQIMTAGMRDRKLAKSRVEEELDELELPGVRLELYYDDTFMEGATNDSTLVAQANASIAEMAPDVELEQAEPASPLFSEDFGSFQALVPGVMYFLGVSNPEKGTIGMPHTPTYVADDGAILVGTRAMMAAMLGRLGQD